MSTLNDVFDEVFGALKNEYDGGKRVKQEEVDRRKAAPQEDSLAVFHPRRESDAGIRQPAVKSPTDNRKGRKRAEEEKIPYTVQDLTNTGISLVHSAGLAGRLHPMMGVEFNSCQYFPAANTSAQAVHPDLFRRKDGQVSLESIQGPGLGYRWDEMPEPRS